LKLAGKPGRSNIKEIQNLTDSINRILVSLKLAMELTGSKKEDINIGRPTQEEKTEEGKQEQNPPTSSA